MEKLVTYTFSQLQRAFPGGQIQENLSHQEREDENLSKLTVPRIFHVGPHVLFPKLHPDAGNYLTLQWRLTGMRFPKMGYDKEGIEEDCFSVFEGENDILGWIGFVREKIIRWAHKCLAKSLDPLDLFPEGAKPPFRGFKQVTIPFTTLEACGAKADPEQVRKLLPNQIAWEDGVLNPDLGYSPRFAFEVKGAPGGYVAGRYGKMKTITGYPILNWGLRIQIIIPKSVVVLKETGDVTGLTGIEEAKEWLEIKYLMTMLNWTKEKIDEEKLSYFLP